MGKKKPFIDKKTASVYHVVRRSQRDVGTEATAETLSDFVLMPSPENAVKEKEKEKARLRNQNVDNGAGAAAAEARTSSSSNKKKATIDFNTLKSQITAAGLQDTTATTYTQYTKPINNQSGQFVPVTSDHSYLPLEDAANLNQLFTDTSKNALDTALEEAMAIHEVGRMLDSIALTADCMEEDMAEALFDFEEGGFEEILDDFCLTANQEVIEEEDEEDDGKFNFEKHVQMLMEKARAQENGGGEGGRELEEDFFGGATPLHGRGLEEEEGDDDDFDYDQYGEEVDEEEDSLDREFNGKDNSSQQPSAAAATNNDEQQQRLLCQKFEEALLEYDSDDVGDLDEECEDIVGDRPLEGDRQIEAALDEFLTEKDDDILMEGKTEKNGQKTKRTGGSGYSALVGTTMVNATNLSQTDKYTMDATLLINMEESKKQMQKDLADADAILANPEMDLPPEEVFIDGKSYFSVTSRNPWDCESILSTYSNLDNNPAVIGRKKKKKKKKTQPKNNSGGSDVIPEDGPVEKIQLSNKTGLPVFNYHNSPEEEEEYYDPDTHYYDEGNDTYLSINRGEARDKAESKMEKKNRKLAIKEERKICRMQKKIMKEAFKEEFQKRGHDVVVDAVGGNTVFRFS